MATYTRTPQRLTDWLDEGNPLPEFLAGHIQAFLETAAVPVVADVSVAPDGTVTFDTDADEAALTAALAGITAADIDPGRIEREQHAGIMAQLDAFADAVDNGQSPTAAQTRDTVARLVRVVQYLAEHRR